MFARTSLYSPRTGPALIRVKKNGLVKAHRPNRSNPRNRRWKRPPLPDLKEEVVSYARQTVGEDAQTLRAKLFRPTRAETPSKLLIWVHSGGFRSGTYIARPHRRIADQMTRFGYACVFLEYRFRTKPQDLSPRAQAVLPQLVADATRNSPDIRPNFCGARAIGVVEDCASFFQWLRFNRRSLFLSDHLILGGSSAGAMTVLNTLFLARRLGHDIPPIATAIVLSGAFAYPSFYAPSDTRILALHGTHETQIPVSSIRRFADIAAGQCTYLEDPRHLHGDPALNPDESFRQGLRRIIRFDRKGVA